MKQLIPGLREFSENGFLKHKPLFSKLADGQSPHTLFITCSDSRIDPCLVTNSLPGELFVVRNAGNIVPPYGSSKGGEEAAIEFAVDGLQVSNIVVCGHSQCGAMGALMDKSKISSLPSVVKWLDHAESTLRRLGPENRDINCAIEQNILAQVENLKTQPSVSAALAAGRIQVFGWIYHFEDGLVTIYDPQSKRYIPSSEVQFEGQSLKRYAL